MHWSRPFLPTEQWESTGSIPAVISKNSTGLEPRSTCKLAHSCQFLSKSLERNARNPFASFQIELSSRIFLKTAQENQKIQWKSVIFGQNQKNRGILVILPGFFNFPGLFLGKSETTVRFGMRQKDFSRFSQVIWTKIDSCGLICKHFGVRVRSFFFRKSKECQVTLQYSTIP